MPYAARLPCIPCRTTLRTYASDSSWLPGIAFAGVLAPCLMACFELSQSRSTSFIENMTEAEGLPSGEVLLSPPSQVLCPPPTPLSRVSQAFGGRLIPSITWQVRPRRVEVSTVPLSSVHTSHP